MYKHICSFCGQVNPSTTSRYSNHYDCYVKDRRTKPTRLGYHILEFLNGLTEPVLLIEICDYLGRAKGSVYYACCRLERLNCIKRTAKGISITAKGVKALEEKSNGRESNN